jgi:hypothetical protein
MSYEHKEGSGSLFKNDKKLTEKHPDYKGDGMVNGKQVWISAWVKEGNKGKYMSLSIQEKDQVQQQGMAQVRQAIEEKPQESFADDDIPF